MVLNVSTAASNDFLRLQIADAQQQIFRAQSQVSSGKKSDVYSGLRSDARRSISLNDAKLGTDTFLDTISTVKIRTDTMQSVMQRVQDIAVEMRDAAIQASNPADLSAQQGSGATKALAQSRLAEVIGLLNTQVEGVFLFSGRNTATAPMTAAGQIGTAGTPLDDVALLNGGSPLNNTTASGTTRYAAIVTQLGAPGGGNGPYYYQGESGSSQQLSARIDVGFDLSYGIPGDAAGFRSLLQGIYSLATTDLTPATEAGYRQVASLARDDFATSITQINTDMAGLGVKQATLDDVATRQKAFSGVLQTQIGNIEDVDMPQAISLLTTLQASLQASFQMLSSVKNLTLANYL
ncbi:MAG: hypothetical protein HY246_24900 [Proteobacteria bacterium]|nr:hypothetical protein [Pseudomonadota bacterium]